MARRKREPMSEGKKNIIAELIEEYDIRTAKDIEDALREENPIKVHPNIIYSTFCGSRMFLFSVSPLSRNL